MTSMLTRAATRTGQNKNVIMLKPHAVAAKRATTGLVTMSVQHISSNKESKRSWFSESLTGSFRTGGSFQAASVRVPAKGGTVSTSDWRHGPHGPLLISESFPFSNVSDATLCGAQCGMDVRAQAPPATQVHFFKRGRWDGCSFGQRVRCRDPFQPA